MDRLDRQFLNWVFEIGVVVALAAIGGSFLDQKFGTGANILSMLLFLAFGVEGYSLYKIIKKSMEK